MASEIGIVVQRHSPEILEFIKQAKPVAVVSLDHDPAFWRQVKERSPETLIFGRFFIRDQPLNDPIANAQQFVEKLRPQARIMGFFTRPGGSNPGGGFLGSGGFLGVRS